MRSITSKENKPDLVCVTGALGLLGQKLLEILSPSYEILALDLQTESFISLPNIIYQPVDISDKNKLKSAILGGSILPGVVINTAAYTDVDGCEKNTETARKVNVEGVRNLVEICKEENRQDASHIKLVHLSTDYIFDGEKGPYSEDDIPNPLSYYGKTKLESEKIITENLSEFIIVRSNVLYGFAENVKPNFVLWVINELKEEKKINVVDDQYNNPTLADNLAQAIVELISNKFSGVINIAGREYPSRYDFALKIVEKFGLNKENISPIHTSQLHQPAPRPLKGGLKIEFAQKILKTKLLDVNEGLEIVKRQLL
jgi:dTDP-4-dehydrorhamnose reductase